MHDSMDYRSCLEVVHSLEDYLHGELTPEQREHLEEHLRLCEECARHFRFEEELLARIRASAQRQCAPPWLRQRLLRMLDKA